jgi:hypothetical protein
MNITLNNLTQPAGLVCLTDIPNILKIEDTDGGTYAIMYLMPSSDLAPATTLNGQWYITFLGETITNVLSPNNAVNKNFYISPTSLQSTTISMARAFRNCPVISANFNITSGEYQGAYAVMLTAKNVGQIWSTMDNYFQTNLTSDYLQTIGQDGSAYSELAGAKIDVDIYTDDQYITTLEKNYHGAECAFNISPVITTFAEYGRCRPFTMRVSSLINGEYTLLGNIDENQVAIGYMCNQGYKYLDSTIFTVANNFSRGTEKDTLNNTILYLYYPQIPISFYNGGTGGMYITIKYLDSAYQVITSTTTTWQSSDYNRKLWDITLNLSDTEAFNKAFYIDVQFGNEYNTVRFNVIKPIKATEYYQRILWRNSYGGISFTDWTGQKTVSKDIEVDTYQKNVYDYYDADINALNKVYDVNIKDTYTLKSHLFEEDGKWVYNDLAQSSLIWTVINGQKYEIILDSLSVDETDNNGIYEATIKFHFSEPTTLL